MNSSKFFVRRRYGGRILLVNLKRVPSLSVRLSWTRGCSTSTEPTPVYLATSVTAVANDQPMPRGVEFARMATDVLLNFCLDRLLQHALRSRSHDLIEQ